MKRIFRLQARLAAAVLMIGATMVARGIIDAAPLGAAWPEKAGRLSSFRTARSTIAAGSIVSLQSVFSTPLVFRFGTGPTGIFLTTFIVLRSTATVASLPAIATYKVLPPGGIVSHSGCD